MAVDLAAYTGSMSAERWRSCAAAAAIIVVALVLAVEVLRSRVRCGGCKGREAVLRTDLRTFRDVLARYREDRGEYPANLLTLVTKAYLRTIPVDPMTKSPGTWVPTFARSPEVGIVDVHSGSTARGSDGRRYSDW